MAVTTEIAPDVYRIWIFAQWGNFQFNHFLVKDDEPLLFHTGLRVIGCAVKRRWSTAGVNPPGNWFAPPGSNQSSSGGNETAEASGAEGREGDLASMQAVT